MSRSRLGGLGGSMAALVTPFRHGKVDEEAFAALCERQIRNGTTALVPCGTTGEAPTLSHEEHRRLIELAIRTSAGRVPVIAGAGSNSTATTIAMVAEAEWLGADGVLCIVPYYNRPSQDGLYQHFKAVQAATTLPVILYDVPARTGTSLAFDTIVALAQLPNILGIKDASGDLVRAGRLRSALPPGFLRLCGDDLTLTAHLALGCHGCISVTANIAPALCAEVHRTWMKRDMAGFELASAKLEALNAALFVESNPIPVKWALAQLGLIAGELRLPLTSLEEIHKPEVLHALHSITASMAA